MIESLRVPQTGELLEYLVNIGAELFIAGHQAEIGVEACGLRMVVSGAEMDVTTQMAARFSSSRRMIINILACVL